MSKFIFLFFLGLSLGCSHMTKGEPSRNVASDLSRSEPIPDVKKSESDQNQKSLDGTAKTETYKELRARLANDTCVKNTSRLYLADICDEYNVSEEATKSCKQHTYTYKNEEVCLKIKSNPEITQSCYQNTYTSTNERYCLLWQVRAEDARYCYINTNTTRDEYTCLKEKRTQDTPNWYWLLGSWAI